MNLVNANVRDALRQLYSIQTKILSNSTISPEPAFPEDVGKYIHGDTVTSRPPAEIHEAVYSNEPS